jgi:hypothetical protein
MQRNIATGCPRQDSAAGGAADIRLLPIAGAPATDGSRAHPSPELVREILRDRHFALADHANGFCGEPRHINDRFCDFDDELICIANILRTPPIDHEAMVIRVGWSTIFPLIASRAVSSTYARNRLDQILCTADVDLANFHRVVDAIIAGPSDPRRGP